MNTKILTPADEPDEVVRASRNSDIQEGAPLNPPDSDNSETPCTVEATISELDALQSAVGEWGRRTFPASNAGTISDHLAEEVVELLGTYRLRQAIERALDRAEIDDIDIDIATTTDPATEAADCVLLLLHLAHRIGFSLDAALRVKFAEVQTRKWDVGADRGYSRHVEAEA